MLLHSASTRRLTKFKSPEERSSTQDPELCRVAAARIPPSALLYHDSTQIPSLVSTTTIPFPLR